MLLVKKKTNGKLTVKLRNNIYSSCFLKFDISKNYFYFKDTVTANQKYRNYIWMYVFKTLGLVVLFI